MKIALAHNHFDASHLEAVKSEMLTLGAPVIKAVWMECYGHWAALEGCHRIRAAADLGLVPEIDEVEYNDEQLEDMGCTVSQLADDSYSTTIINFED